MHGTICLAAFCALNLLGACTSPRSSIEGDDSRVLLPDLRATWSLSSREPSRTAEGSSIGAPAEFLLDAGLAYGGGEFVQELGVGEVVQLDSKAFVGPTTVMVDFDLYRAFVDVRYATAERHGLRAELFGGIGASHLEIEARSAGERDRDQIFALGPLVGLALVYRPVERWRLFVEGSMNYAIAEHWNEVSLRALDVGVGFAASRALQIGVGLRDLRYEHGSSSSTDSDLDLGLSGFLMTLRFLF